MDQTISQSKWITILTEKKTIWYKSTVWILCSSRKSTIICGYSACLQNARIFLCNYCSAWREMSITRHQLLQNEIRDLESEAFQRCCTCVKTSKGTATSNFMPIRNDPCLDLPLHAGSNAANLTNDDKEGKWLSSYECALSLGFVNKTPGCYSRDA